MPSPRPRSLRHMLGLLTLVLSVPMLGLALLVGTLQVRGAQMRLEEMSRADARAVLHRVDLLVLERIGTLRRAAMEAREGRLAEAMVTLEAWTGLHLALLGPGGAVLRDSRPPGTGLPQAARTAALALVGSRPLVSPLVEDPASGGHALLMAQPLAEGLLVLALPAEAFRRLLEEAGQGRFDETRFPALADAEGRIVARWLDHAAHVGQPMPPDAHAAMLAAADGTWRGENLSGVRVQVVHATSALSGLSVGIGITQAALREPFWHSALILGPAALLLLGLAAGATLAVARWIREPVASLGAAATALAEGRSPPRLETPLAEVNAVAAAMASAAEKRAAAEAQRDLLVRELHHRVKNLLTTAQSLATLSARSARDPVAFAVQFGDRLRAMARTHSLLLEDIEGEVVLGSLLAELLAPYRQAAGRIVLDGPEARLGAEAAVPLGMVLHELATNAAKYGALSSAEGRLSVTWRVEPAGAGLRLLLEWAERDGPRVEGPPDRVGFGTQLLRRALAGLPGGQSVTEWREEGLVARLALELRGGGAAA